MGIPSRVDFPGTGHAGVLSLVGLEDFPGVSLPGKDAEPLIRRLHYLFTYYVERSF